MKPGTLISASVRMSRRQAVTFAYLFLLIADVKTRKWNFLLEEHNKLSEMPTLLILYRAIVKLSLSALN